MKTLTMADAASQMVAHLKGQYLGPREEKVREAEIALASLEIGQSATLIGLPFGMGSNPRGRLTSTFQRVGPAAFATTRS
jgi:hypothetical protein